MGLVALLMLIVQADVAAASAPEQSDIDLLARMIWAEAENQDDDGQQAVAQVAINRLEAGAWGDTMEKVIYAPNQFAVSRMRIAAPGEREYANARAVMEADEPILPIWVQYFRAGRHHRFKGYAEYTVIGDHYFGGFEP